MSGRGKPGTGLIGELVVLWPEAAKNSRSMFFEEVYGQSYSEMKSFFKILEVSRLRDFKMFMDNIRSAQRNRHVVASSIPDSPLFYPSGVMGGHSLL